MTKAHLIESMSDAMGVGKAIAEQGLNCMIQSMVESLTRGERVSIGGIGTFRIADRGQKQGRNPKTGELFLIPPTKVVKFRPASTLKEAVEKLA